MSVLGNTPLLMTPEGYQISRSVRLRSSASAYFNRTPTTPTNNLKWTYSCWFKRGTLGTTNYLLSGGDATYRTGLYFDSSNGIGFFHYNSSTYPFLASTSAVFRDPSAWYHIVFVFDCAQATSSNGLKLYVNGVQQTLSISSYTQNNGSTINNTYPNWIGWLTTTSSYADGYLTEVNFIDGQALTPSSFGETDSITGVWKPKKYAGTYGTNGFYLNFSDNSAATAATIGKDYSGNGNNWTPNNISVTSGVTYDSMLDVPTPYADGGNGRGNYAVLNPVFKNANATYGVMATPSDGNLNATMGSGTNVYSTMALPTSGKIYVECEAVSWTSQLSIGFMSDDGNANRSAWWNNANGIYVDNAQQFAGATSTGIIGIAVDCDAKTVQFYRDNSARGSAYTYGTGSVSAHLFWAYTNSGATVRWNFGQRPFTYTPPTGFKALNTQNLPEPTIKKGNQYFDATTYTGAAANQTVTNSGSMQPDLVWLKSRSNAYSHYLYDAVRGVGNSISSDSTGAEQSFANSLTAFNSNGFSLGNIGGGINQSGSTFVGWQWKESASAGFDIVTYTGTGANRTVAHSLGVTPSMMIVKSRSSGADGWPVFHSSVGNGSALVLNSTSAINTNSVWWNNTSPSSSVFTVGTNTGVNGNAATYVAYLFAEVAGFSKFGSYTGNGSADGPFVYCGFRPRFLLVKRTDSTGSWQMKDTARNPSNLADLTLFSNLSNAEYSTFYFYDLLSNGFKVRSTDAELNASGGTYIYAAFAENPFKNSLAR